NFAIVLHETIHELHTKKHDGIIFKIDFEKAYDKVSWDFLQQALRMKGFSPKWCSWVQAYVQGGNVGIKVNDHIGPYFQSKKGLRQGDPLSPILFNIVVDMLAVIISRAKNNGQVKGVIPHLVEGGLSILQYADDTVIFLDHDLDQAKHLKMILCLFEQLSGLKINFHKSEIFCFGQAKELATLYADLFGCKLGSYPFRYLGLSMHIPRGVLKKIKHFRSRFFWQYDSHKRKYRLIKWPLICQPKDQRSLGIQNLDIQNKCLLSKWPFKLCNEDGLCQKLLRNKYVKDKPLAEVEKKTKRFSFLERSYGSQGSVPKPWKLVSKNQLRFWKDIWLDNQALKFRYPILFHIVRKKHATVANVLSSSPLNISFRRGLVGNKFLEWHNLVASLIHVKVEEDTDIFMWGLHKTGSFTVRSMYRALISNDINMCQEIWRLKIPLKIKIFLWFLKKEVLLTKDNLVRRNWRGSIQGIHWLLFWAQLQRTDDMKDDIVRTCRNLESSAMELFASRGWPFMFRIVHLFGIAHIIGFTVVVEHG
ncbi:LOW QUALITY PROTEIN: hypothetical protein U9M48_001018, partial [Paspalum notatum var. saurae]